MDPIHSEALSPEIFQPLLEELQKTIIPKFWERKNSGVGRTLSLGILRRRNYGLGPSRNNLKYNSILMKARALASIICPEIYYNAITINEDYTAATHRDKNNHGVSCVVAFGDYEGGELCIAEKEYSIRHRPFKFLAAELPHRVNPITSGKRYSIVFYKQKLPQEFIDAYGDYLTYEELESLLPEAAPGTPASSIRILY